MEDTEATDRRTIPYVQILDGCGDPPPVTGPHAERLMRAVEDLRAAHAERAHSVLAAPFSTDDIEPAATALARLSEGAKTIVFFGTGGSSLGGQTLAQVGGWNIPGDRGIASTGSDIVRRPRTRFYDNLDGRTLGRALDQLDLTSTRFVAISKSGNTPETLVQTIAALQAALDAGLKDRLPRLFLGVSEPSTEATGNGLRTLFGRHDIPCLDHPVGLGGRFSALSIVGLLPAMVRGLDVNAVRAGACAVVDAMMVEDPHLFAPAAGAAMITHLQRTAGIRTFVMMPYSDRLGRLAHWYGQLLGESLGKDGKGGTPVAALGPVDQHSQLQLWMDGPREHMVTFIRERCAHQGPVVDPELAKTAGITYLAGRPAGALVAAQSEAVPEALRRAGRPHRIFDLERVDEFAIGGIMMHFMIETILAGHLLDVDPFDQPAVEMGKRLARDLLAKGS